MAVTSQGALQDYSFTAPISGYAEIDLSFGADSVGGGVTTFGTLTETLYYDPIAQTLRQVGSVSVSPSSISTTMTGGLFYPGLSGTANLTVGDGSGEISFDTGTQYINSYNGDVGWSLAIPISGTCAVDNNGRLTTGQVNYSENPYLITDLISESPSSLVLSEQDLTGASPGGPVANIGGVTLFDGVSDNTYYYGWSVGQITATAVPEPDRLALFAGALPLIYVGICGLWALRRKKMD